MKSYTDLEQSKKLAEILPVESADMGWNVFADNSVRCLPINDWDLNKDGSNGVKFIPTWSLAALFKLLPKCVEGAEPSLIKTFRDDYRIVYNIHDDENITSEDYTNPIDACYEIIIKLKQRNLL